MACVSSRVSSAAFACFFHLTEPTPSALGPVLMSLGCTSVALVAMRELCGCSREAVASSWRISSRRASIRPERRSPPSAFGRASPCLLPFQGSPTAQARCAHTETRARGPVAHARANRRQHSNAKIKGKGSRHPGRPPPSGRHLEVQVSFLVGGFSPDRIPCVRHCISPRAQRPARCGSSGQREFLSRLAVDRRTGVS